MHILNLIIRIDVVFSIGPAFYFLSYPFYNYFLYIILRNNWIIIGPGVVIAGCGYACDERF